jgi:hypothetical protein
MEEPMSRESRLFAGILLVVLPTVMFGGLSLLHFLTTRTAGFVDNPLRHDLFRAGHAHAGVYLVLSLVMLRYVDETALGPAWKWLARVGAPIAAILIPAAFFLSVALPDAREASGLINLAYIGAIFLAAAVLTLGVGLIRAARQRPE